MLFNTLRGSKKMRIIILKSKKTKQKINVHLVTLNYVVSVLS